MAETLCPENSNNPCCKPQGGVVLPTICSNDYVETGRPHEPPIGFDGGSLNISWNLRIVESGNHPNDIRPYKYVFEETGRYRGPVAVLKVLTELREGGQVSFARYLLPIDTGAQLLIWLQQLSASPEGDVFEPMSEEAQVLVRGDNLLIECDRRLAAYPTYKYGRPEGYEHPGYQRHFRIAGWAVVDQSGGIVHENNNPFGSAFMSNGEDGYKISVYFHDSDRDNNSPREAR